MKINIDIISKNIEILNLAKKYFPVLVSYEKIVSADNIDYEAKNNVRTQCIFFNLTQYTDFIDFVVDTKKNSQEVIYNRTITNKELQDVMIKNSFDEDAAKCFKRKGAKSLESLINSHKYLYLSANYTKTLTKKRKKTTFNDNIGASQAIICNFFIQNDLDLKYPDRLSRYYTTLLPPVDLSIIDEIDKTDEVIEFIIEQLTRSKIDFRKVNYKHLLEKINDEIREKILKIEPGEKIKCIQISGDSEGLTLNKNYDVISKEIDFCLQIRIVNDFNKICRYNYRLFESLSITRDNALDELLKDDN